MCIYMQNDRIKNLILVFLIFEKRENRNGIVIMLSLTYTYFQTKRLFVVL